MTSILNQFKSLPVVLKFPLLHNSMTSSQVLHNMFYLYYSAGNNATLTLKNKTIFRFTKQDITKEANQCLVIKPEQAPSEASRVTVGTGLGHRRERSHWLIVLSAAQQGGLKAEFRNQTKSFFSGSSLRAACPTWDFHGDVLHLAFTWHSVDMQTLWLCAAPRLRNEVLKMQGCASSLSLLKLLGNECTRGKKPLPPALTWRHVQKDSAASPACRVCNLQGKTVRSKTVASK